MQLGCCNEKEQVEKRHRWSNPFSEEWLCFITEFPSGRTGSPAGAGTWSSRRVPTGAPGSGVQTTSYGWNMCASAHLAFLKVPLPRPHFTGRLSPWSPLGQDVPKPPVSGEGGQGSSLWTLDLLPCHSQMGQSCSGRPYNPEGSQELPQDSFWML